MNKAYVIAVMAVCFIALYAFGYVYLSNGSSSQSASVAIDLENRVVISQSGGESLTVEPLRGQSFSGSIGETPLRIVVIRVLFFSPPFVAMLGLLDKSGIVLWFAGFLAFPGSLYIFGASPLAIALGIPYACLFRVCGLRASAPSFAVGIRSRDWILDSSIFRVSESDIVLMGETSCGLTNQTRPPLSRWKQAANVVPTGY